MEPITSDTILILAGSFLCVFLSLVTIGGTFLVWRTRQLKNSGAPPPAPPPVTRDVHAAPLGEMPTRHDSLGGTMEQAKKESPIPPKPVLAPPPAPIEKTEAQEPPTERRSRPELRPLGVDLLPVESFDEGGETTTRNISRTTLDPIVLPSTTDTDTTPTVIIDRSKPVIDDDET